IVLSSREFGAEEAKELGLISRITGDLRGESETLVKELRSRDPEVLKASKRYYRAVRQLPTEARSAYALVEQTRFAERRKHCTGLLLGLWRATPASRTGCTRTRRSTGARSSASSRARRGVTS